ncbi:Pup--protein ligase [Dirofilaria immitis]
MKQVLFNSKHTDQNNCEISGKSPICSRHCIHRKELQGIGRCYKNNWIIGLKKCQRPHLISRRLISGPGYSYSPQQQQYYPNQPQPNFGYGYPQQPPIMQTTGPPQSSRYDSSKCCLWALLACCCGCCLAECCD